MMRVFLTKAAKEVAQRIAGLGMPDSAAIIITTDATSGMLVGRYVDKTVLETLQNAKYLSEAIPGIDIFTFGIDEFPSDAVIELNCLHLGRPLPRRSRPHEESISFFLQVRVKRQNACYLSEVC